jgi:hypothetical protein
MASQKIQITKNYRLFKKSVENRPLNIIKHAKLKESMQTYGFLASFPIVCRRDENGDLVVMDGQHRLYFAEELKLPVAWVEEEKKFDIAFINSVVGPWNIRDYAMKFAANGKEHYQEAIEFADLHGLPIGIAFAMLYGSVTFHNLKKQFMAGEFEIRDFFWAERVATLFNNLVSIKAELKSARLLESCMGCCRVVEFDPKRLVRNARRCGEKLISYATKEGYMGMLEEIYNFGHSDKLSLKLKAIEAMRSRIPNKPRSYPQEYNGTV